MFLLPPLLARLAAKRERQRSKPAFGDWPLALHTASVLARLEARERGVDASEDFYFHLQQREIDICLDVGVGILELVIDFPQPGRSTAAEATLHLALHLAPAVAKYLPQVCIPSLAIEHVRLVRRGGVCPKRSRASVLL
jgi:hypothetical protein